MGIRISADAARAIAMDEAISAHLVFQGPGAGIIGRSGPFLASAMHAQDAPHRGLPVFITNQSFSKERGPAD